MSNLKLPSSKKTAPKKMPRPYTTYNVFFQLEREFILQHELNVAPDLLPEEVFDPSSTGYNGPDLPRKYQGLVLRADWHMSGKTRRNKRSHRKSHGAIGFCELSKRISLAWRNSDAEVKLFCAQLADMGQMAYKKKMHKLKTSAKSVAAKSELASCEPTPDLPTMDWPLQLSKAAVLPTMAPSASAPLSIVSPETDASALGLPPLDFTSLPSPPFLTDVGAEPAAPRTTEVPRRVSLEPPDIDFASVPSDLSSFLTDVGVEPTAPRTNDAPRRVSVDADQEWARVAPTAPGTGGCKMVDMPDAEIFSLWLRA